MPELYLKYIDEYDLEKRVLVETQDFFLGRHSDNDLAAANPKLSRTHAKIERYDDIYLLSDFDSSNGTKLNDFEVTEPTKLQNGDVINLGDGLIIDVVLTADDYEYQDEDEEADIEPASAQVAPATNSVSALSTEESDGGFSLKLFAIMAVSIVFVLLLALGVAAFFLSGRSKPKTAGNDGDPIAIPTEDVSNDPVIESSPDPIPADDVTPAPTPSEPSGLPGDETPINIPTPEIDSPPATPEVKTEAEKAEAAALSFMRKIARNDPTPVLTGPQLAVIAAKTRQFRGSSALKSNIQNARRNSQEIATIAASRNMKTQFLAGAALAQLGNRKGDVAATAKSMIEVLGNVQREVGAGNETANDSLLTIAAYDVGQAGNERRFRDMISRLTQQSSNSPRQIRTIWFLKDRGKISNAQFEFALRFLAIGTITQNPKAYGVNAEVLSLN